MTPAARASAALELLVEIMAAVRSGGPAADTLIARYFAARRYAGSKDRAAVRDLIYAALRQPWVQADTPPRVMLAASLADPALLFGADDRFAPTALTDDEQQALLGAHPPVQFFGLDPVPLLGRAPVDVRVDIRRIPRESVQADLGGDLTRYSPWGLRLPSGTPVEQSELYRSGLIDVQDEGSQLIALATGAKPGDYVIDLCAGAGGKTLALAAMMNGKGRLVAADINPARLERLRPRAARAGLQGLELADSRRVTGPADCVLVDAPCTGTGTWRRNPEARFRLSADALARVTAIQSQLLDQAWGLLRAGGRLVYAVCSLLPEEGAAPASAFSTRSGATPLDVLGLPREGSGGVLLHPASHGCDGFFIACWQKP
jgi:16S rRNA (cytosine967-C5)-methyltransferase